VEASRGAGAHVIDRNNLTIIEEPGFDYLPGYLAEHEVEVIASLPCYSAENVNKQRGNGVFEKSISALRKLNAVGYGTELPLNLVYNPLGATLPGPQQELEADYKEVLGREFGIAFNHLYTITNQPIARFAEDLRRQNKWNEYLELLATSFNPETVAGLMCRNTLSVDYEGRLYDCDFNQMLDIKIEGRTQHIRNFNTEAISSRDIRVNQHCYGCTAGTGSSCSGSTT
ncbi:MAG TPA: arsenosugar biosynthesis radical SAM (seleno)protein ArsS, partial [Chryseosolibacter sp.]|nr:arsenosugar biosynthesis radical SAM (seleno)protein ArsS [Chryseosolibacter sp.]